MNDLQVSLEQLPANIEDLTTYIQVGREKLISTKAELRAITKVNMAAEIRAKKLTEAQDLADALLFAEVRLGELIAELPELPGRRTDLIEPMDSAVHKSKKEILNEIGLSVKTAQRLECLAAHPDVVSEMTAAAREAGEIVSRTEVLRVITESRQPYIVHNSGDEEWYTPKCYIESATATMQGIDLDPASCDEANSVVCAKSYFDKDADGLSKTWYGNIWLNPPYSQVGKFIDKLCTSNVEQAIVLTQNATETVWFKKLVEKSSAIVFLTGRKRFWRPAATQSEPHAPMQGQAITYIGPDPDRFLSEFLKYGWGMKTK